MCLLLPVTHLPAQQPQHTTTVALPPHKPVLPHNISTTAVPVMLEVSVQFTSEFSNSNMSTSLHPDSANTNSRTRRKSSVMGPNRKLSVDVTRKLSAISTAPDISALSDRYIQVHLHSLYTFCLMPLFIDWVWSRIH